LKKTILGGDETLREEEVMLILGVNVGDAPRIAENGDGMLEPGKF
jgi:hypothetical protein